MFQKVFVSADVAHPTLSRLRDDYQKQLIVPKPLLPTHITLSPPVEIEPSRVNRYISDIKDILCDETSFEVQTTKVDVFLNDYVIKVGVAASEQLKSLHEELLIARQAYVGTVQMPSITWNSETERLNYQAHKAVFVRQLYNPHVTLAQARSETVQFSLVSKRMPYNLSLTLPIDSLSVYVKTDAKWQRNCTFSLDAQK